MTDNRTPAGASEPARRRDRSGENGLIFDGRPVPVSPGQTVAGALWQAGIRSWRTTRRAEAPPGLFCGIGACYDFLATVDGATRQPPCLTPAQPRLVVEPG